MTTNKGELTGNALNDPFSRGIWRGKCDEAKLRGNKLIVIEVPEAIEKEIVTMIAIAVTDKSNEIIQRS
jgi:hypothetical protein